MISLQQYRLWHSTRTHCSPQ